MREAWEDIYDSFKKIEVDLKGDGEAITATIDKLYQGNKGNRRRRIPCGICQEGLLRHR